MWLVRQCVTDIVDGLLHVSVGCGEVVFCLGGVEENVEFFIILALIHIADGLQQLVRAGVVTLSHLGTGQQHLGLIQNVRFWISVHNIVQHALCLDVILLVEIGFGHQEVSIINGFDVLFALEHHGVLVDGL